MSGDIPIQHPAGHREQGIGQATNGTQATDGILAEELCECLGLLLLQLPPLLVEAVQKAHPPGQQQLKRLLECREEGSA